MQKKKKKDKQTNKMKVWNLKSWLALCPTNYIFNILYYSFFPQQPVHSLFIFYFFFALLFSDPHTSSHTPRFLLLSVLNFLSSLSFYVVFLFVLLFSFVCVFFNLMAVNSSYDFSPLLTQVSHRGFFVLLYFFCKVRLFISFFFFFWVESLVLQSKLHAGRILNFGRYLLRVSWLREWGEGFLFERVIQFQSPNDAV